MEVGQRNDSRKRVKLETKAARGIDKLNAQPNQIWADITDHAVAYFQDANAREEEMAHPERLELPTTRFVASKATVSN